MSTTSKTSPKIFFVAEPRADVVLLSSDNVRFLIRKISLQAPSDVFDEMFSTLSGEIDIKDEETGLPVIQLSEKAADLDALLCLVVRNQRPPHGSIFMPMDMAKRSAKASA
jgi:hypothetical protein